MMSMPQVVIPNANSENQNPRGKALASKKDKISQQDHEYHEKRSCWSSRAPLTPQPNGVSQNESHVPPGRESNATRTHGPTPGVDTPYSELIESQPFLEPAKSENIMLLPNVHPAKAAKVENQPGPINSRYDETVDFQAKAPPEEQKEKLSKLSSTKLYELASSHGSIPIRVQDHDDEISSPLIKKLETPPVVQVLDMGQWQPVAEDGDKRERSGSLAASPSQNNEKIQNYSNSSGNEVNGPRDRPTLLYRAASTPAPRVKVLSRKHAGLSPTTTSQPKSSRSIPSPLDMQGSKTEGNTRKLEEPVPSPAPPLMPLPPMSISSFIHLELSSGKPSPLYIHRSLTSDFPYESSRIKTERLLNFLLLPPQLEMVLWFGALACLDAWLYTFTILPLRFIKALSVLCRFWTLSAVSELKSLLGFIYLGLGRLWRRRGLSQDSSSAEASTKHREEAQGKKQKPSPRIVSTSAPSGPEEKVKPNSTTQESARRLTGLRQRRPRPVPSDLLPVDKADILKGLLIMISCFILMYFDASMMYHSIRGQAAIKLYVIYNVLEVFDRLLSALGQDILECLFSKESLERKPNGRSKILRPFWLFILALVYNIVHSTALFYQVITLNVAVNSYSNALLTLLMSNQFVEIKSTVFKKFEKENLFQITCADVVERFQLWLMLMIIASRNVIETNNLFGSSDHSSGADSTAPLRSSSILPNSFTMFPNWMGQVLGPFFLVLGTEMLVDWLKHAYITKFNNTKPNIYGRFLDILAKDYYSNAFADQNLTRRLGLPVVPLSCLFIRASVQTYQMFLATHLPLPLPSPSTSLSEPSDPSTSPANTAAMLRIDQLFRRALGRHVPAAAPSAPLFGLAWLPSADAVIARVTTIVFFLLLFLVLLLLKILLGMALLRYARGRYGGMKAREQESAHADGKRVGGWGMVEVDEDKRRWIYEDDAEGPRKLKEKEKEKERESRERERAGKGEGKGFAHVERYSMVAKRIW